MQIKKQLREAASRLVHAVSYKKTVLFESVPDCSDNTKAVFDEMVRRGLHKKYTFVWMLHSETAPQTKVPGVMYLPGKGSGLAYRWRQFSAYARAKCMLCCNGFLLPVLPGQTAIYLSHGTPVKYVRDYYNIPTQMTYALGASEDSSRIIAFQSRYPESQMISLGFPRNDAFSVAARDIRSLLKTGCKKVIVWYPTYRQHKNGKKTAASNTLPIIHDGQSARRLNEFALEQDVLLVLKPHFAQDLSYIKNLGLSNIRFIDDSFFTENAISSYAFVASGDALITDYSSVYFDYTLADKPIAAVWEDVEEYRKDPGFAVDLDRYMKGAEKIFTLEQFEQFIGHVARGEDVLRQDRREIRDLVNYASDGKNSARVVDFIVEAAGLSK